MPSYLSLLRHGEFRAVLVAHVAAMLAIVVGDISLTVLVYQRTSSPLLAALTFAVAFVPMGLGALFLGGVGRRRPSRDVLVACEVVAALLVGLMAAPGLPIPLMLALLAVKGSIDPIFAGTRAATLTEIVGDDGFPLARSLLRIVSQNAQFAGFGVGGVALVFVTPTQALTAAALAHAAAAGTLLVGTRRRPAGPSAPAGNPLVAARDLLAVPRVRPLLAMFWLPSFFFVAPEAVAVAYADALGGGPAAVGLLLTGLPAGSVLGELLVGSRVSAQRRTRLIVPLAIGGFVPVLLFAVGPPLAVAVALLVLAGFGNSMFLGLDHLALATVPEDVRRRGFALVQGGMMVSQGLGFAAAGALAERLPAQAVIPLMAAAGLLVTLVAGRALRRAHPAARLRARPPGRQPADQGADVAIGDQQATSAP